MTLFSEEGTEKYIILLSDGEIDMRMKSKQIRLTVPMWRRQNRQRKKRDFSGRERYQYVCYSDLSDFVEAEYAAIQEKYGSHIPQAETDDIMEREVKFFVWAEPSDWAFLVVPVYRRDERLFLGKEEEFLFENDNWAQNFFDGMK